MASHAGIRGAAVRAQDREGERVEHRGVRRRVACRGDRLRRCAGEPLVEMQPDGPVPGRREQGVAELAATFRAQQRRRQPQRFVPGITCSGLRLVARPEDVGLGRAGAVVAPDEAERALEQGRRPERARVGRDDAQRRELEVELLRARVDRGEERLPRRDCLAARHPLEHHRDLQRVVAPEAQLLAPVRTDQRIRAEVEREADQLAERRLGRGLDGEVDRAEGLGQRMYAQRQPRDDREVAAAAALERPEELGIAAGVADADLAVGGHDLGLEQAAGGGAERFREAAEAAALHQPGDAHRRAASPLHVAGAARRHGVVDVRPHRARAAVHRALRRDAAGAAGRDEGFVERHLVHAPGPHQQRIGRVGRALVAVAAALDDEAHAPLAREVDGGGDVGRAARDHGVGARRRAPRADPAEGLRQGDVVADRPRVLRRAKQGLAGRRARHGAARGERRCDLDGAPPTAAFRRCHSASLGQSRVAGADAPTGAGDGRLRKERQRRGTTDRKRHRCQCADHAPAVASCRSTGGRLAWRAIGARRGRNDVTEPRSRRAGDAPLRKKCGARPRQATTILRFARPSTAASAMTALPASRRWLALYILCFGVLMIVLDSTIVNVALPSIREDLGFTETARLGGERLPAHLRRLPSTGRPAGRPARPPPRVPRRPRRVHRRLGRLRPRQHQGC